jgi:hypothetical protein
VGNDEWLVESKNDMLPKINKGLGSAQKTLAQYAFRVAGSPMQDFSSFHAPTHGPLVQGWPARGRTTLGSLKERETTPKALRLLKLLVVLLLSVPPGRARDQTCK